VLDGTVTKDDPAAWLAERYVQPGSEGRPPRPDRVRIGGQGSKNERKSIAGAVPGRTLGSMGALDGSGSPTGATGPPDGRRGPGGGDALLSLIGERVTLRPHARADAAWAYPLLAGRDEILRWLVWRGPTDEAELAAYYEHWNLRAENGDGDQRLAVVERASGAGVGSVAIRLREATADVGYWIGLPYQNRGYASEAVELALHHAFRHLDAQAVCASVFVGNKPSKRVLERAGFRIVRTGVPRRIDEREVREWHLTLLRVEWEARPEPYQPVAVELPGRPAGRSSGRSRGRPIGSEPGGSEPGGAEPGGAEPGGEAT